MKKNYYATYSKVEKITGSNQIIINLDQKYKNEIYDYFILKDFKLKVHDDGTEGPPATPPIEYLPGRYILCLDSIDANINISENLNNELCLQWNKSIPSQLIFSLKFLDPITGNITSITSGANENITYLLTSICKRILIYIYILMKIKKINNIDVKPIIKTTSNKEKPIKGNEMFNELYFNLLILARKNSGKTTLIFNIIKNTVDKNTKIFIFCPTCHIDNNYLVIIKWLKKHKINYELHLSLNNFLEIIEPLYENINDENNEEEKQLTIYELMQKYSNDENNEETQERKNKYRTPEYLFIFDDLASSLRNKKLDDYFKRHRHMKIRNIISTQYIHDLLPSSIRMMDYLILMKGINDNKLLELYKYIDLNIDEEKFIKLYENITSQNYNFFIYISKE